MRCSGPVIVSGGEKRGGAGGREGAPSGSAARLPAGLAFPDRERALVPRGAGAKVLPRGGGREGVKARASPSLPPTQKSAGRDLILPPSLQASQDPTALRIKGMRYPRLREALGVGLVNDWM